MLSRRAGRAGRDGGPRLSRLVCADPGPDRGVAYRKFFTARLAPPEMDFRWGTAGWIIEPLVYQDEALGYIMIECGSEDPVVYETLLQEMSTAVKGALLRRRSARTSATSNASWKAARASSSWPTPT